MTDPDFLADVIAGLSESPKRLSGKYLWDEAGSILFDRICDSPDYYPTQREMALISHVAPIVAQRVGPGATIVEYGSGASRKVRILLKMMPQLARYIAIDISGEYLRASLVKLAPDFPGIAMVAVRGDYSKEIDLPFERGEGPVLGFFPGTSIGNFPPEEATAFLARARRTLGQSYLLVGADTTQDEERLASVYGGCGGLMEALHLNILARINRELGADIPLDAFRHEARVRHEPFRVEAHLVATRANTWQLGGRAVTFATGESVRTDTSHKYVPDDFKTLAGEAGWTAEETWIDSAGLALYLFRS